MSVVFENQLGWILSHSLYTEKVYRCTETENLNKSISFKFVSNLFDISSPYLKRSVSPNLNVSSVNTKIRKRKIQDSSSEFDKVKEKIEFIKVNFKIIIAEALKNNVLNRNISSLYNKKALEIAEKCYIDSLVHEKHFSNKAGGNNSNQPLLCRIDNENYLFPENCQFFCKNVSFIESELCDSSNKFDVIVLDPPWWNKYIRRKKAKRSEHSYKMMYNEELKSLPIDSLLTANGLVVIWCTNSKTHLEAVENMLFPQWNVKMVAKWFWLKVTTSGEPICDFSEPPGKQPFEQIIFGCRKERVDNLPPNNRLVISVPSALHSHKPPLVNLLNMYIEPDSKCLEIFARYLLPGWTSWGLETCRFQHSSLYEEV